MVALTPSPLPSAVSVLMEKRGEETGTTGTMMGSLAIIGRSRREGGGDYYYCGRQLPFVQAVNSTFLL